MARLRLLRTVLPEAERPLPHADALGSVREREVQALALTTQPRRQIIALSGQ